MLPLALFIPVATECTWVGDRSSANLLAAVAEADNP